MAGNGVRKEHKLGGIKPYSLTVRNDHTLHKENLTFLEPLHSPFYVVFLAVEAKYLEPLFGWRRTKSNKKSGEGKRCPTSKSVFWTSLCCKKENLIFLKGFKSTLEGSILPGTRPFSAGHFKVNGRPENVTIILNEVWNRATRGNEFKPLR